MKLLVIALKTKYFHLPERYVNKYHIYKSSNAAESWSFQLNQVSSWPTLSLEQGSF